MLSRIACLVVVALAAIIPPTLAAAADPPRYMLPVGRVLEFSGEGSSRELDSKQPASKSRSGWRFVVLAQNPDGSARVLARSSISYSHRGEKAEPNVSSAVIDLYPDGRYRIDPALAPSVRPEGVFPRLPDDADRATKQWQSDVDWTGSRTTFTPKAAAGAAPEGELAAGRANEFVFTGVQDGPINRIYVMTFKATHRFDPSKGLVTRSDGEHTQNHGFHSKGGSTLKLDKDETLPAEEVAALAGDYATYTDAVKVYRTQVKGLERQPDKARQIIDTARMELSKAAEKVQHPDVKQQFKTKLQEHDESGKYSIEQAERLAKVLNKPAADWSSKDLNDQPISAQSLRGKVVVMDFWYRGCGWCMYAMPQVKQVAARFKDKPVAVLGMNTDQRLEDARFVVKELGLEYPQVLATGIPEKFGVQAFPTLIVIDKDGVVRDVHVGYSHDLFETVSTKVEELLNSGKAAG